MITSPVPTTGAHSDLDPTMAAVPGTISPSDLSCDALAGEDASANVNEHKTRREVADTLGETAVGLVSATSARMAVALSPDQPHVGKGRMEKPRICIILHGKRADEADVRKAVIDARDRGYTVDVKVTWEAGDVERHVADIVRARKVDTIVAAGGDGTLTEVVAALLSLKVPRNAVSVGLLPVGTSNDFAAVSCLPKDLSAALMVAADPATRHPVDVGLLNRGVFMNTSTLGASSELGAETSHEAKRFLGPAAYLIKGVVKLSQYAATSVILRYPAEGEDVHAPRSKQKVVEVREQLLNLTAGNSRQVASMLQPCPDALLDDGLLDITYVIGNPGEASSGLVGEMVGLGSSAENIRMLRVPWIEVESLGEALSANRDGEPVEPSKKFLFETVARRILLHLPHEGLSVLTEGAKGDQDNAPAIKHNRLRPGMVKEMFAKVVRFGRVIPGESPWWLKAAQGAAKATAWVGLGYAAAVLLHAPVRKREPESKAHTGEAKKPQASKMHAGGIVGRVKRLVGVAV